MLLIDRYISQLFIRYLFAGIFVFLSLFVTVDILANMSRLEAGLFITIKYYLYWLPFILYQLFPATCLLATLFTFATLNKGNELVALFSFGLSLGRVTLPILTLVILFSALLFWGKDKYGPYLFDQKNYVETVEIKNKEWVSTTVKASRIWYKSKNIIFNLQSIDKSSGSADGVTFFYIGENGHLNKIVKAKHLKMQNKREWLLENGQDVDLTEKSNSPIKVFNEKIIKIDADLEKVTNISSPLESMRISELRQFIKANKKAGLNFAKYEVEYHSRVSFSLTAIILTLLGIPFVVANNRKSNGMINVVICLILCFIYWTLYFYGVTLGKNGYISPFLSGWIVNIVTFLFALFLIIRLKR